MLVNLFRSALCWKTRSHLKTSTFTWVIICLVDQQSPYSKWHKHSLAWCRHPQTKAPGVCLQTVNNIPTARPLTADVVISMVTQLGARHSHKPISMCSQKGSIIHSQWAIFTKCLLMTSSAKTLMIRLSALGDIGFCDNASLLFHIQSVHHVPL